MAEPMVNGFHSDEQLVNGHIGKIEIKVDGVEVNGEGEDDYVPKKRGLLLIVKVLYLY